MNWYWKSKTLLCSASSNCVNIWDPIEGICLATITEHNKLGKWNILLTISNKILIASGSDDYTIKIWDTIYYQCTKTLTGHIGDVTCLTNLNDQIVSACFDNTIKIWNVYEGIVIKTLNGHTEYITCLTIIHYMLIASGSWDKKIKMWDPIKGICTDTISDYEKEVNCLIHLNTPNGILIVSGGMNGWLE